MSETDAPDRDWDHAVEDFEHAGLECRIANTRDRHYCGYVKRPESVEPVRWRSDYDSKHDEILDAEVDAWGGITYGPDPDGWLGFDDGHARSLAAYRADESTGIDATPRISEASLEAVREETKELAEQIANLAEEGVRGDHD